MKNSRRSPHVLARLVSLFVAWLVVVHGQGQGAAPRYLLLYHWQIAGPGLDDLTANLEDRGFDVETQALLDDVHRDSIKAIIAAKYKQGGLRYVLLVGAARRSTDSAEAISDAASGNLIPTYYGDDLFGSKAAYDHYYTVVDTVVADTVVYEDPYLYSWPNLVLGRLPVLDSNELNAYVHKLEIYTNDAGSASWKNNVLLLAGDRDRGAIDGNPPPGTINLQMAGVRDYISTDFDRLLLTYSNYSSDSQRQDTIIHKLNSGQALLYSMGTGANGGNLSDMLYRGPGSKFDASSDLDSTVKFTVVVGASCNLGQADTVVADSVGSRFFAENMLVARNRGAIAFVGPSAFSAQSDNHSFLVRFAGILNKYPRLPLGEVFTAAKYTDTLHGPSDSRTLQMYTYYGDPSLVLSDPNLTNDAFSETQFEFGVPLPLENTALDSSTQVKADSADVSTVTAWYGKNRVLRVKGTDSSVSSGSAYSSWLLYDGAALRIDSTRRFLQYTINAVAHPEDTGRYGVNCILSTGAKLSDSTAAGTVIDQYGKRIGGHYRKERIHQVGWYAFDLTSRAGDTIDQITVEYDAASASAAGPFEFLVYDILLSAHWGSPPTVSAISGPASMVKSTTATVSVTASDFDVYAGDTLKYAWTATAGYFTGSGSSRVYHAPSSAQTVTITVTVSDLGGYVVTRQKDIVITNGGGGGGCPFLYVQTTTGWELDNVILTGSENTARRTATVVDHYALGKTPVITNNTISLRIAEEENERSYIYAISLEAYDVSGLLYDEQLAMRSDGNVIAIADPIVPILAQTSDGADVTERLLAPDSESFVSYRPDWLTLVYDLRSFAGGAARAASGQGGSGGPPPNKERLASQVRINAASQEGETEGNYLTVSLFSPDEQKSVLDVIYGRRGGSLPVIVDFTPYINSRNRNWFAVEYAWTKHFEADNVTFYAYRSVPQLGGVPLAAATDENDQDVTALLAPGDERFAVVGPGERLELHFDTRGVQLPASVQWVLKATGYYVKDVKAARDPAVPFISANFPNPFNPVTSITLDLPASAHVELEVFNVLGQHVRTLVDRQMDAGGHSIQWDGTNDHGSNVSSGVYFYKVRVKDWQSTSKMVLLR